MRKLKKSGEEGEADDSSSPISCLPDEIILQILNKIIDLKSLCCCYVVSKRFSSIVVHVDTISFTAPLSNPNTVVGDVAPSTPSYYGESFVSARTFLNKFRAVKSLCIRLPSSFSHIGGIDNRWLFKWKVNFGSKIDSFVFLLPNSFCGKDGFYLNGNGDEEEEEEEEEEMGLTDDLLKQKYDLFFKCVKDVIAWHMMLMYAVRDLPMSEKVSITDSGRRGRLSLSGEKLSQVKEWAHSTSETEFNRVEVPDRVSRCYIPVLNLPVSGYVMKGAFCLLVEKQDLQGGNDGLLNSEEDGFEQDREEAAFTEAMKKILEKHKDMMRVCRFTMNQVLKQV